MQIFIVEDDSNIREMESYALKNSGFQIREFENGDAFLKAIKHELPDLVLLDLMLPGEDGLSILNQLKGAPKTAELPVIIVTAKDTELDKVRGLDLGADDYLTKPFGIMELISRIKAVLRRTKGQNAPQILSVSGIRIDDEKHLVTIDGEPLVLTFKEYELLKYLMRNQGVVLSRNKIMSNVWSTDYQGESRTVDMHIKTLRQKLGDYGASIKTIRNVGYKID